MKTLTGARARQMREKLGERQGPFWARLGVTQSGGSRYESGRGLPRPVQFLLVIACGTERQATAMVRRLRRRKGATAPARQVRGAQ